MNEEHNINSSADGLNRENEMNTREDFPNAGESEPGLKDIISLIHAIAPKEETASICRNDLVYTDSDGNTETLIRYSEYDANGNLINEHTVPKKDVENYALQRQSENDGKERRKQTEPKQFAVHEHGDTENSDSQNSGNEKKPARKVKRSDIDSPKFVDVKDLVFEAPEHKLTKEEIRQKKINEFFKHFLLVIIPVTIILFVMFIGQRYIDRASKERIRVLEIETEPLDDELTTQKVTININTANTADFTFLPGIGEAKAKKIIDYRNSHGPFKTIEEIKNVNGIGESTFENIKPYITVE